MPIEDVEREAARRRRCAEAALAIDRDVLAAWLGDDAAAINSLLAKFRDTAIAAEREIAAASRAGDLAVARGGRAQAQRARRRRSARPASAPPRRRSKQAGKAGDRTPLPRGAWARSPPNCAARSPRSTPAGATKH